MNAPDSPLSPRSLAARLAADQHAQVSSNYIDSRAVQLDATSSGAVFDVDTIPVDEWGRQTNILQTATFGKIPVVGVDTGDDTVLYSLEVERRPSKSNLLFWKEKHSVS